MLMNNLDPEVAEDPDHLVVYGGTGRAARSWDGFDAIVRELRALDDDETLLVQSRQAGRRRSAPTSGRRASSSRTRTSSASGRPGSVFRELERPGLMMYGQMTAGLVDLHRDAGDPAGHVRDVRRARPASTSAGRCAGRVTLTAGLGGMGGAQPLAVTMNDGVCIAIEVDEARARRRLDIGYVDRLTDRPDEALALGARRAAAEGEALSHRARRQRRRDRAGLGARRASGSTSSPTRPPRTTPLGGYVPAEIVARRRARAARPRDPDEYERRSTAVDGRPRPRDARLPARRRRSSSTTATTCAPRRRRRASPTRSTTRASCRRSSGRCSARAAGRSAGSRCPAIRRTSCAPTGRSSSSSPTTRALRRWIEMAEARVPFQGLPARICWLGYGERAKAGPRVQRAGRGPARSARRSSSAATTSTRARSPRRTARPRRWRDGSDAIADWPLLNALVNTAAGATWVSIHHGGGVGIGYSPARRAWSSSPTARELAARKLERVLTTDPGDGRHAPRRRRLRARDRGRPRARRPHPDARRSEA